tara:strand:- start:5775 stop:8177 length:2403 start_codon:yes stop_codon:yes gene_type:complete
MASGSYAIAGLKLADGKKRDRLGWKVEADKQSIKRGEIVTFTITAENAKFPDGTKRKFVISENFSEADIVDGKIAGEFELFGNKAKVEIGIEETYEKPQDETLRFGVTSTFAFASVNVESDGGGEDIKRLRDKDQKRLPPRQEIIRKVVVKPLQLPSGGGSIVPRPRPSLPTGGPKLPGTIGTSIPNIRATPKPQSSGIADLFNNAIQTGTDAKGNYLTKEQRISAFKKGRPAKPTKGIKPITSLSRKGGPIGKIGKTITKEVGETAVKTGAKTAGKAVAKGGGKAIAKKIPGVGLLAGAAFGIERLLKGDIIGAIGELASGAASTVPGVGTAVSLGIDAALMGGDMISGSGQKALPPAKFKEGGTIIPGMTNMPFSMPGLNGVFNEPGNPEVMSILPLNKPDDGIGGGLSNLFGGKEKEYKGIASAIGQELENRGIGDPLGVKGGKSYGNTTRDLLDKIPGMKSIFGNRGSGGDTNIGGGQDGDGFLGPQWLGIRNPLAPKSEVTNNNTTNLGGGTSGDGFLGPKWMGIKNPFAKGKQEQQQVAPQTPMQPTASLETPGTFIQGDTGNSRGDHFHIGPETELWGKPEGKKEARRAGFKVAKGLINKGESFSFTNANIDIDPNNPPDDPTLMKYIEQEQAAHASRSGGGSFGGLDIAGRKGLRMPVGVSDVQDRGDGFGISGTISGTRAFVGHGAAGSTATPTPAQPTKSTPDISPVSSTGSAYQAPSNAAPSVLLESSAETAMRTAGPKVAVVQNPVTNTSTVTSGGSGQSSQSKKGSDMSDAGLLAYMAKQRLLTLGG